MRWDIIICAVAFPLIPILNALIIRWRKAALGQYLSLFQTGILCLALAIVAITLGNIVWILLGIGSGVIQAIFTEVTINQGLQLGFDRAIPLNEKEDLVSWGLLPPVLVGLCLNLIAHFICMRVIQLPLREEQTPSNTAKD